MNKNSLKISEDPYTILLGLLTEFIKDKTKIIQVNFIHNPLVVHYYNEIIRYWNRLNYAINKSLRSLDNLDVENYIEKAKILLLAYRILYEKANIDLLKEELNLNDKYDKIINRIITFSWDYALKDKSDIERLSLREAIPTFFIKCLTPVMEKKNIVENIRQMNKKDINDDISFSINNFLVDKDLLLSIKNEFKALEIKIRKDHHIPFVYHTSLVNKKKIILSKWYKENKLIFHDRASAAVVHLLSPQPNELIGDLCAAPGIKTNLILNITKNQSRIIALDFNRSRITIAKNLLSSFSALNYFLINADSINLPIRPQNYFDKILIDAPCTGSGTFLINPELKWRQNTKFLHQNLIIQEKLIKSGLNYLKDNGILVYSTCSLYPEEGELQIMKFREVLEPLDIPKWFSPSYKVNNAELKGTGRLFPAIHKTQGFFVGKFKKKKR